MTTITRNLSQIQGANVPVPTQNGFSSNGYEVFANDAAYEAAYPGFAQGAAYYNSTECIVREYDGTNWVYSQQAYNATEDSTSTGTDQELDLAPYNIVRFTEGSLESIIGLDPSKVKIAYLSNEQGGQAITLKNQDGGATAGYEIITGTGDDLLLEDGQTLPLVYDGDRSAWLVAGGAGGSGGGLSIQVITNADSPVTGEIGTYYLADTTAGPIIVNLPEISTIPPSQLASATVRFADCAGNWHVSNLSVVSGGSDTQNYPDGTSDTDIDLNVQGQNNEFSVDSATSWCMTANFQPIEAVEGSGAGGKNYYVNGDFNSEGTTGWSKSGDFSVLSIESGSPLEGTDSLTFTADANSGTGQVIGQINVQDEIDLGNVIGHAGAIKVTGTGEYSAKLVNTTTATDLIDWGTFTATASGTIFRVPGTFIGTTDTIELHIDMVNSVSGDTFILDGFKADPEGTGVAGDEGAWQSYIPTNVQGFTTTGSPSIEGFVSNLQWRTNGSNVDITGSVVAGTAIASEARIEMPNSFTPIYKSDTDIVLVGSGSRDAISDFQITILATNGLTYLNFGKFDTGVAGTNRNHLLPQNGNAVIGSGQRLSFFASVPVAELQNNTVQLLDAGQIYQSSRVRYYVGTSHSPGGNSPIEFDTESTQVKKRGNWSIASSEITFPSNGTYLVNTAFQYSSAGGDTTVFAAINGNRLIDIAISGTTPPNTNPNGSFMIDINDFENETLSIRVSTGVTSVVALDLNSWIDITRVQDSTGNQPVGAGTSLLANETAQALIPIIREATVALDGAFTSGNALVKQIDNLVTITFDSVATHSSSGAPATTTGLLPEWARPTNTIDDCYRYDSNSGYGLQVNTNGSLLTFYLNESGSVARTDTFTIPHITYIIT